jgi:hypothetical protein
MKWRAACRYRREAVSTLAACTASDVRMVDEWCIEKDLKGSGFRLTQRLSHYIWRD